jgi:hypothetical protein
VTICHIVETNLYLHNVLKSSEDFKTTVNVNAKLKGLNESSLFFTRVNVSEFRTLGRNSGQKQERSSALERIPASIRSELKMSCTVEIGNF